MAQRSQGEPRFRFTAKVLLSNLNIVVHLRLPDRPHTRRSVRLEAHLRRIIPSGMLRNPYVYRAGAALKATPRAGDQGSRSRAARGSGAALDRARLEHLLDELELVPDKSTLCISKPKGQYVSRCRCISYLGRRAVADAPRVPHAGTDSLDGHCGLPYGPVHAIIASSLSDNGKDHRHFFSTEFIAGLLNLRPVRLSDLGDRGCPPRPDRARRAAPFAGRFCHRFEPRSPHQWRGNTGFGRLLAAVSGQIEVTSV
jgi:hypothetical protein